MNQTVALAHQIDALVGTYRFDDDEWTISREDDALVVQPARGMRTLLVGLSPAEFYPRSDSFTRIRFSLGTDGTAALEQRTRFPRIERAVRAG
jgi:hypothetical protein